MSAMAGAGAGSVTLMAAGTQLCLRPDGTVWWPERRTLFAADLHLGKGAAFRAQGQPVPAGRSAETLAHLEAAAQATGAQQLVLLGDLWHHASGLSLALHAQLAAVAARWPITLVLGNHDMPLARQALHSLPISACTAPLPLGPLRGLHEPNFAPLLVTQLNASPSPEGDPVTVSETHLGFGLAGHLHPAVHLGGRGADRLRRPCFLHFEGGLVLPAFGRWTGVWAQSPAEYAAAGARVAVVGQAQVQWLPSSAVFARK